MKNSFSRSIACRERRRVPNTGQLAAWAASVVAEPAAHGATQREADIIGSLLREMGAQR